MAYGPPENIATGKQTIEYGVKGCACSLQQHEHFSSVWMICFIHAFP